MTNLTLDFPDLPSTHEWGRKVGEVLFPGAIIGLNGQLGAGKTHLVRGIAEGLQVRNLAVVNSPTFVLIQEYQARLPIFHFDTYRLTSTREFLELGVEEYYEAGGVCLIEWAERVEAELPGERLMIRLQITGPDSRQAHITAYGPRHQSLLSDIASFDTPQLE
jgi:tRNA threonylcarbamoyladenosine biosynthesis protein TsaE